MPERYRRAFDEIAIREHAAIVGRRGLGPSPAAHVEIWRQLPKGVGVLCVVADDRPGLLSFISASLVMQKMDVVSAQAYTRLRPKGGGEAVDLLWVRRDAGEHRDAGPRGRRRAHRRACSSSSSRATLSIEVAVERARPPRPVPPGARRPPSRSTRTTTRGSCVLTVETFDRPGSAPGHHAGALPRERPDHRLGRRHPGRRVVDRFSIVEIDGSPIRRPPPRRRPNRGPRGHPRDDAALRTPGAAVTRRARSRRRGPDPPEVLAGRATWPSSGRVGGLRVVAGDVDRERGRADAAALALVALAARRLLALADALELLCRGDHRSLREVKGCGAYVSARSCQRAEPASALPTCERHASRPGRDCALLAQHPRAVTLEVPAGYRLRWASRPVRKSRREPCPLTPPPRP